jgi:hypothetical protein
VTDSLTAAGPEPGAVALYASALPGWSHWWRDRAEALAWCCVVGFRCLNWTSRTVRRRIPAGEGWSARRHLLAPFPGPRRHPSPLGWRDGPGLL